MSTDERNNVIPLPPKVVQTRDGTPLIFGSIPEGTDLEALDLPSLITQIESCGFESEGGPLELSEAWCELVRRLGIAPTLPKPTLPANDPA